MIGQRFLSSPHSINYFSRLLFLLLIANTLVNLTISSSTRNFIKEQNILHLSNSIDLYAQSLHNEFHAVERFLYASVNHDEELKKLNTDQTFSDYQESLKRVKTSFTEFQYQNETHITFLIQTRQTNHFTNASDLYLPYEDYLSLKEQINQIQEEMDQSDHSWYPIQLNSRPYLIRSVHYQGSSIYAVISEDEVTAPLQSLDIGQKGQISLHKPSNLSPSDYLLQAKSSTTHLPFELYVTVDYGDVFKHITLIETLLSLVPLVVAVLSTILILYIRHKMISPVKRLTRRLSQLGETDLKPDLLKQEAVVEINQANDQLRQILFDMQALKISEYQAQLQLKKVELNYLKNQVRPHFYLNMLSMIHSMLQTQDYKEIESLTVLVSDHLRYLFTVDQDFSILADEIRHIED